MADCIVKNGGYISSEKSNTNINLILVATLSGCSTAESEPAGTNNKVVFHDDII